MSSDFSVLSSDPAVQAEWGKLFGRQNLNFTLSTEKDSTGVIQQVTCTANDDFKGLRFTSKRNHVRFQTSSFAVASGVLMALDAPLVPDPKEQPSTTEPYAKPWTLDDAIKTFGLTAGIKNDQGIISQIYTLFKNAGALKVDLTESRCAMWLFPGESLQVATEIPFVLDQDSALNDLAQKIIKYFNLGINLTTVAESLQFSLIQTLLATPIDDQGSEFLTSITSTLTVRTTIKSFVFWLKFDGAATEVSVTRAPNAAADLATSLSDLNMSSTDFDSSLAKPTWDSVLGSPDLWYFTVSKGSSTIDFQIRMILKWMTKGQSIDVFLSYDSRNHSFEGGLLFAAAFQTGVNQLLPSYDPRLDKPSSLATLPSRLDLTTLFDTGFHPPGLPTQIVTADISFTSSPTKTLTIDATLVSPTQVDDDPTLPPSAFDWDTVSCNVTETADNKVRMDLFTSFTLRPSDKFSSQFATTDLSVHVIYDAGLWTLHGDIFDLQFGSLAGYFPKDLRDAYSALLGNLTISDLSIDYTFGQKKGKGAPSSFAFAGTLLLGKLGLKFMYQCVSSIATAGSTAAEKKDPSVADTNIPADGENPGFKFEASLGAAGGKTTIGEIADSIISGALSWLPSFVSNVAVNPVTDNPSPISLKVKKIEGQESVLVSVLEINLDHIALTFVQISGAAGDAKRALRITLDQIPMIDTIPIVKELPQPFEKLIYLWVLDEGNANGDGGFNQQDILDLNPEMSDPLLVKDTKSSQKEKDAESSQKDKESDNNPVIHAGHHFMVVEGGKVVVDHIFGGAKEKPVEPTETDQGGQKKSKFSDQDPHAPTQPTTPTPAAEPEPTTGALSKNTKFLSISSVGLQYKEGILWLSLNAQIKLGPIEMDMMGFALGLTLSGLTVDNLKSIVDSNHLHVKIDGLGVDFSQGSLAIAGVFSHQTTADVDSFSGGVGVSFEPYTFVAVGEYAIQKVSKFTSFFIYGKLDGLDIFLEFALLTGIRLGFGYNSLVRSPALDELTQFPFIDDTGSQNASTNPISLLQSMEQPANGKPAWVSAKQDSYWFAAGLTLNAFDLLKITAIAMLAFRDRGVVISLFADAVAQMPPDATSTAEMILYVEIAMLAELNMIDQYFRVEASLAPTSFLLVPQCHLSGGFALCYWFGDNPHAGDWVFTVGGYHKAYTPPSHYPVPSRLSVSFQCGNDLSVTAEAYFAITPMVVMGGAMLHVSLGVGPVSAYMDASFDALINFQPFHYNVEFSIAVGVECDIDILFIHIHVHVQIGADLQIAGPEFGGVAHVDFWFFGFDVRFGADTQVPGPIDLPHFYSLVHSAGPKPTVPQGQPPPIPSMTLLKFNLEDGNFPMPIASKTNASRIVSQGANTNPGVLWHVKGGSFKFRITCDFAISKAVMKKDRNGESELSADSTDPNDNVAGFEALGNIYSKPMQIHADDTPIHSVLFVRIIESASGDSVGEHFKISYVLKPVPLAVWGPYDSDLDPAATRDLSKLGPLLNGNNNPTVTLATGIILEAPDSVVGPTKIPAFNATDANKANVPPPPEIGSKTWPLKPTSPPQSAFIMAVRDPKEVALDKTNKPQEWIDTRLAWQTAASANSDIIGDGKITASTATSGGILGMAASLLGWDTAPASLDQAAANKTKFRDAAAKGLLRNPWELSGAFPSRLVVPQASTDPSDPPGTMLGGLEEYYLALPRFCVPVG